MAIMGRVKASDLAKNVTLEVVVTGMRLLRVRIWLGVKLLWFVGKILGVGKIEVKGVS